MNTMRAAATALAAILVLDVGHGFAAVLCKNRAGGVILRDKCKKKETQLDLVQLGGVCPKGEPGPPGSGSRVVDADGRSIGPLIGYSELLMVAGGKLLGVRVDTSGFAEGNALSYTTNDCSGTAYLRVEESLVPLTVIVGSTLFYPVLPTQPQHLLSDATAGVSPTNCVNFGGVVLPSGLCCVPFDQGTVDASLVATFDLASLGFVPPFHVEIVP